MYIIDRFEGKFVVIEKEDRSTFNLPRDLLPKEAHEGDVIDISIEINHEETRRKKKHAQEQMEGFFDK